MSDYVSWDGGFTNRYDNSWRKPMTLKEAMERGRYHGRILPKPLTKKSMPYFLLEGKEIFVARPSKHSDYVGRITPLPRTEGLDPKEFRRDFQQKYNEYIVRKTIKEQQEEVERVLANEEEFKHQGWNTSKSTLEELLEQVQVYGKAEKVSWF